MIISFKKLKQKLQTKEQKENEKMKLSKTLNYELLPSNDSNIIEFDDLLS